jgi:ATP-dependent DNA ligase
MSRERAIRQTLTLHCLPGQIRTVGVVLAEIEFLEWAGADHVRHTKFVGLRDDKDPRKVVRET